MNMKELASLCGVSVATVSYALRDDARVSEAVRKRIAQKAREVGYKTNPQNSALVRYRKGSSEALRPPTIAIVYAHGKTSRRSQLIQPHIKVLRRTVKPYGYRLKEFFLGYKPDSQEELLAQLRREEIRGIVLGWGEWQDRMEGFPWEEFAVVSAERNQIHPSLDRISMNHFSATDEAFQQLEESKVSRIGLICHTDLPLRVRKNIIGSYRMNVHRRDHWASDIPPYFYTLGESPEAFLEWFSQYQLDAILSHRIIDLTFFKDGGIRFPQDAQYAVIEIDDGGKGGESGVIVRDDLGRVLAETIAAKLHYDERVNPESEGNLILVDGYWHNGSTTSQ